MIFHFLHFALEKKGNLFQLNLWIASSLFYSFLVELQRIQVECLMASVVAFVVTVELIALRGKMTDVARQE